MANPPRKNIFLSIDLLGQAYGLKFNGDNRPRSIIGGVCTLLMILATLSYSVVRMMSYWKYELSSVSTLQQNMLLRDVNELYSPEAYKLLPVVRLSSSLDLTLNYSDANTLFRFLTPIVTVKYYVFNPLKMAFDEYKENVKYKKCRILDTEMLCPEFEMLKRHSFPNPLSEKYYFEYSLGLYPCMDRSDCISKTIVHSAEVQLWYQNIDINVNSYENTTRDDRVNMRRVTLSAETTNVETTLLQLNEVIDRMGFPRKDKVAGTTFFRSVKNSASNSRTNTTSVSCTSQDLQSNKCDPYTVHFMEISNYFVTYQRNYTTLFQVFTDVGGIYSSICLVLSSIYMLLIMSTPEDLIVEQVYKFRRKSQSLMYYLTFGNSKYEDQGSSPILDPSLGMKYVPTKEYKAAVQAVCNHLDVISIVRDIIGIKFILGYLMEECQRVVLPDVTLHHELNTSSTTPSTHKSTTATSKTATINPIEEAILTEFSIPDPSKDEDSTSSSQPTTIPALTAEQAILTIKSRLADNPTDPKVRDGIRIDIDRIIIDAYNGKIR